MTGSHPLVVTVSAAYGAGGSVVAPELAEVLGIPFLDRAIPRQVAQRLDITPEEAERHDQAAPARLERILTPMTAIGLAMVGGAPGIEPEGRTIPEATADVLHELAQTTGGVILGRAGAAILHDRPQTLRVRLTGPPERRVEQAMRIEGVDRQTAAEALKQTDRAREVYAQHFHGADLRDPGLYHLVLDTTAIELDACVDLVARAARALTG